MIYSLTEIRELQLNCIRQLKLLIATVRTIPSGKSRMHTDGSCPKFISACEDEIKLRKHLFNNPDEVQI